MPHEPSSLRPDFVRLELTLDQQAQVRASLGVEAEAVELGAHELEMRIVPATLCASGRHFPEVKL